MWRGDDDLTFSQQVIKILGIPGQPEYVWQFLEADEHCTLIKGGVQGSGVQVFRGLIVGFNFAQKRPEM